jgi:hypothetical protein
MMSGWDDEMVDFEEQLPDDEEADEAWWKEEQTEISDIEEEKIEALPEGPDVWWAEDIRKIENPIIREKEIEAAQEWLDERDRRLEKYESGEKDIRHFGGDNPDLDRKGARTATRCAIESEGITYDDLADLSEDAKSLEVGELKFVEDKERVKKYLGEVDPEVGKELAEKVIEEHELSEEDAESIRRLVRLRELKPK